MGILKISRKLFSNAGAAPPKPPNRLYDEFITRWNEAGAHPARWFWLDASPSPPLVLGSDHLWVALPEPGTMARDPYRGLDGLGVGDVVLVGRDAEILRVGLVSHGGFHCGLDGEAASGVTAPYSPDRGHLVPMHFSADHAAGRTMQERAGLRRELVRQEDMYQGICSKRGLLGHERAGYAAEIGNRLAPLDREFGLAAMPYLRAWFPELPDRFFTAGPWVATLSMLLLTA